MLLLVHRLTYGGTQRQVVELARGLRQRGHDVVVAVFYGGGPLEDDLRGDGIVVRELGKGGRWDLFGFFSRAAKRTRRVRPDVIYSFLIAPNLLALVLWPFLRGAPVVWGVRASRMDLTRYDTLSRVTFRTGAVLSSLPARIIVNSVSGRNDHHDEGYPADSMVVVPNGVNTERFRIDPVLRTALRDELGYSETDRLIGIVARLDPMKDHPTFLEAAAILASRRDDVRFLCVGDGPDDYAERLRRRATRLGLEDKLGWTGARHDVEAVFNALDVATSTSLFGEGFPNAVAEALACGCPCVVTDVGDSALIVEDPARVVPPGDPRALADAWERCLDEVDAARRERERARIVSDYSVEALARRTERELGRVLAAAEAT